LQRIGLIMNTWWQQLVDGLRQDFAGFPGSAEVFRIAIRLVVAAALGALLGYQREHTGKAAGIRTHMLVALGAAVLTAIPSVAGWTSSDASRIMQGLITGIGFLGAGTIVKHADEGHVSGLTTAAGIWTTAAVGMAAGLGREVLAILGALLALVILVLIPHISRGPDGGERH
jgi:putative Mg2+ transporter-C (MgtC) family protein